MSFKEEKAAKKNSLHKAHLRKKARKRSHTTRNQATAGKTEREKIPMWAKDIQEGNLKKKGQISPERLGATTKAGMAKGRSLIRRDLDVRGTSLPVNAG